MNSLKDPSPDPSNLGEDIKLDDVRAQIRKLEADNAAKGIKMSGRILHICHYLPVSFSFAPQAGVLSPPPTPPAKAADAASTPDLLIQKTTDRWMLTPRYGHSAMFSGIRSMSATHEQVIIGWTGDIEHGVSKETIARDTISPEDKADLEKTLASSSLELDAGVGLDKPTTYVPVWLDTHQAHDHYEGYCKTTLWPLFHYLLWQDVAKEYSSADEYWPGYEAVNKGFAQRVLEVYRPGDLVWIHDYHLLLVPQLLRLLVPDAIIGLFLHTPFPSSEVFRCLPRRKELLDGMLGANLVCFQTYSYLRHFTSSCVRVCGYETAARGIDNQGHITAVAHCAVGVDADRVTRDTLRPGIEPKVEALRKLYENKKIIVGRDKLDVVKGVVQKLLAFEKLLQTYPEWIGNVVLIQVTSPSMSDASKLERKISELVARINGEYGQLDFVPVHHYHQTIKKDDFYSLLTIADLAVITPLRDGMNTTSMEFVIAQERSKHSPLVLSEFMGISSTMSEALQVNPWNLGDLALAMHKGLLMSESEKLRRHAKLYKIVTTHTSHTWAAVLTSQLLRQIGAENTAHQTPYLSQDVMRAAYKRAQKRLFLFDYDGTLTPIVKMPSMALPSEETLLALEKLSSDPRNLVYIISGRDGDFLQQHLGHLSLVGMSAEHGGFMREPGQPNWTNLTESFDMSWMSEVEEIFRYYTERTTGSHIEIKKTSITWHYRASDPEWGEFQCRQCQDLLENNLAHKRPIEVLVGKKNLEVRSHAVNKGEIVKRILYQNPDAQFVFCAGDDKTDEDMFRALSPYISAISPPLLSVDVLGKTGQRTPPVELAIAPEGVFSTAVGHSSKRTLARWHVTSPAEVVDSMLDLLKDA